jgi:hypothetical protein
VGLFTRGGNVAGRTKLRESVKITLAVAKSGLLNEPLLVSSTDWSDF